MDFVKYLKEALNNLWQVRARSFLAMLGIIVGTASVVALISSSRLATDNALQQFKSLGTNLLAVSLSLQQQNQDEKSQRRDLQVADMPALKGVSPDILNIAPYTQVYGEVYYKSKPIEAEALGVTDSFAKVVRLNLSQGRLVSVLDKSNYYCVVGSNLAATILRNSGKTALGQQIQVNGSIFTIVGVAAPWKTNMFLYTDLNDSVLVSLPTSLMLSKYTVIYNVLLRTAPGSAIHKIQTKIKNKLSAIVPEYNVNFRNPLQIISVMSKQRQTFSLLLIFVGSIALVVGGIGVMNIMLVSVIERKREIGIRMAVGARKSDIRRMFLLESVLLTAAGGVLGLLFGVLVTWGVAWHSSWGFALDLLPLILGFGVSVVVGVLSGVYPAIRASKLDPVVCLRAD